MLGCSVASVDPDWPQLLRVSAMNANVRCRTVLAPTRLPVSALPADSAERAAFKRLVARGVITGREPTPLAALDAYREPRPLLQSPPITAPSEIPEVLE